VYFFDGCCVVFYCDIVYGVSNLLCCNVVEVVDDDLCFGGSELVC